MSIMLRKTNIVNLAKLSSNIYKIQNLQYKHMSSLTSFADEDSFFKRTMKKFGWTFTDYKRGQLQYSGYKIYIKLADDLKYDNFFQMCRLEDTFASWFTITELHVWMMAARLMQDGEDGKITRNSMIKAYWEDIETKSKKLEGALPKARREQIQELGHQFSASLVGYDEGHLGSDKELTAALWRKFFKDDSKTLNQKDLLNQIVTLEMLVIYTRSQLNKLSKISKENLYLKREFRWDPFDKELFNIPEVVYK